MSTLLQRRGHWYRLRWQLAGGFVSAAIPYLIRLGTIDVTSNPALLHTTFIGSVLAIAFAAFCLRGVSHYPGAEGSAYIVPALALGFGLLIVVFFLGRIEYTRYLIISSFLLSLMWFYVVHFMRQRRRLLRIGVVELPEIESLHQSKRVEWIPLAGPDTVVEGLSAVAVDLRRNIDPEWDRRLADFALAGLPVYHVKHLLESLTGRVELEHLNENSFGSLSPQSAYMTAKHCFDWLFAAFAGIVLLPFAAMLAVAIKLESSGPVIFRQERTGYRGKPFTVYKFRSMTDGAGARPNGLAFAVTSEADKRITRLGAVLRRYRIDEIPQILNILRGEMSWIGPRPEATILSSWYESEISFYRYRHIVRPGLTGWAQVCQGYTCRLDEIKTKLHYDFYYIKNYSAWIDLLIIARTVQIILSGFGAR